MTVVSVQPGLGIGFDADHAFRNADAERGRGGAFAAVRHAQHRLVGGADRRFAVFEGDVGGGRANDEAGAERAKR